MIYIPELLDPQGNEIVPASRLGKLTFRKDDPEHYKTPSGKSYRVPFSVLTYQECDPPALAILRHAFFDKHKDGSYVSPEYRKDFSSNYCVSEYTCTFREIRDLKSCEKLPAEYKPIRIINKPMHVVIDSSRIELDMYDPNNAFDLQEPPMGWVTKYDLRTGYPLETSEDKKDAKRIFGQDASYFFPIGATGQDDQVSAVYISCNLDDRFGPFYIVTENIFDTINCYMDTKGARVCKTYKKKEPKPKRKTQKEMKEEYRAMVDEWIR